MRKIKNLTLLVALLLTNIIATSQVKETLDSLKKIYAPDLRVAVWEINTNIKDNKCTVEGKTDNLIAKQAIISSLKNKGLNIVDKITVLPDTSWVLVKIPYAHLRVTPGHESELTSQALMGTPLRVLETKDGWLRVQTPDNYISWIIDNSTTKLSAKDFNIWKDSRRFITTSIYTYLYDSPKCVDIVSDLLLGDILKYEGTNGNVIKLSTPDGRVGYAKSAEVEDLSTWANQRFNPEKIIYTAKKLMGSTYTWGGTSTKGVDCSGLTKTCYFANGIILQRDASQQVLYGTKINPTEWLRAQKGDLLYFGTKSGRVTHTAIYLGNGKYIHASGLVKVNSIDPQAKDYLTTPFLSINRIDGNVDAAGIKSVRNHNWYFNK